MDISCIPNVSFICFLTLDEQTSSTIIPKKKCCIHFTNLPSDCTAEILSQKFGWNSFDILMGLKNDSSSLMQCWLINVADEIDVGKFVEKWNRETIGGSTVECETEEDELELCDKFRIGQCPKSDHICDWEHVRCEANGSCASSCPYGHEPRVKPETIDVPRKWNVLRVKKKSNAVWPMLADLT